MLFALMLFVVMASSGDIFANSVDGIADNLFTKNTNDLLVNSFQSNDISVGNINQVSNSKNAIEFMDNHYDDSSKPVINNTYEFSANCERDYSPDKTQNNIIGNKANTNVIVDNAIDENKAVDNLLSTEEVISLTITKNQTLSNNLNSSGLLFAGDGSSLFSRSSILTAATNVKNFVEKNGRLPNYVTVANQKVSMSDFLYLLSKSIVNVNKKLNSGVLWENVKDPSKPSGNTIKGNLNKNRYLSLAQNVVNFIEKNGQAPNFGSTALGKVQYQTMVYGFARILDFTRKNGVLPNYVTLNTKTPANLNKIIPKYESSVEIKSFTGSINVSLADIKDAGVRVEAFINSNNKLPNYVTISGRHYSMAEFLYLVSTAIVNMKNGVSSDIVSIAVKMPVKSAGNSIAGEINEEDYVDISSRISTFIVKNGQAPNFGDSPLGRIDFELLVFGFSKILRFSQTDNTLPNFLTLNKSGLILSSSLNDIYNRESLARYLAASKNCQVNDATIKALAAELTRGATSEWAKAESIFNHVKNSISYSFYYNTIRGAKKTLTDKIGNCVDQSHLLIALFRASNLASRYVNGKTTFTSGSTYGHTWVQVKIGDTWVVADTTSSMNSLGVIKNWNNNNPTIYGTYAEISF
jgi:hypothetical protein